MSSFSTPAILIRRVDFGDFDLIVTFLTLQRGKLTTIAKSAKRSTKRFAGTLELFNILDIVVNAGKNKGLPILTEASVRSPLYNIGTDIMKTAYASYWAELVYGCVEEGERQVDLFRLLMFVLQELDNGSVSGEILSILFQMRFLTLTGLCPSLEQCCTCRNEIAGTTGYQMNYDLAKGGLICESCSSYVSSEKCLSRGTIKQLRWLNEGDMKKAIRIRFSASALQESQVFLEAFVPFHLGKEPKSLHFLRRIRSI